MAIAAAVASRDRQPGVWAPIGSADELFAGRFVDDWFSIGSRMTYFAFIEFIFCGPNV